jgi:hypothetical protein
MIAILLTFLISDTVIRKSPGYNTTEASVTYEGTIYNYIEWFRLELMQHNKG